LFSKVGMHQKAKMPRGPKRAVGASGHRK